jgi:hypothetical protein
MYEPPTDFLALCTSNLPTPAVIPSEHFNTVLYTGNNTANTAITGVGFQPDFLYIKSRSSAGSSNLYDVIRGAGYGLTSNSTAASYYTSTQLTSFDSDGFTLPADTAGYNNINNRTYAAWNWKANGSGSANTVGAVDSTVSVNDDAGFSIVRFVRASGDGVATVGHGLTKTPEMIIKKHYNDNGAWYIYHKDLASGHEMYLNDTNATTAGASMTAPSSTVINFTNLDSGQQSMAYCFHSVDGYSKVGSYGGNGNANGSFVYTGFRPIWVLLKRADSTNDWGIYDTARDTYNLTHKSLYPNVANGENVSIWSTTENTIDILSNGFKTRTSNAGTNANGGTYIYWAFAETPFKYTNAR